ncbi:MAG: trypsin-like peptidase domain-containing protein [Bacilli bacterium]|nr:trypsin-like peptidase domain-containing protein [Bacilli bacterium]
MIRIKKIAIILLFFFLMFVSGCQLTNTGSLINESDEILYLEIGENLNLMTTINNEKIYWEVETPDLLLMSDDEVLTLDDGLAYIVARDATSNKIVKKIAIVIAPSKPKITIQGSQTILVGKTTTLISTITPSDYDQNIVWSVTEPEIATIDENGVILGIKAGITRVIATSKNDETISQEINIIVQKEVVENNINNEIKESTETIDVGSLSTVFSPIISKGLSSLIGVSTYNVDTAGNEIIVSTASGVIYKRNILLKTGEEVAYDQNIETNDIEDYKYYVLTNRHVIQNSKIIRIYQEDKTELDAELIQYDKEIDLAVLSFTSKLYFPVAVFGNSDTLEQGEFCLALGNPFGYDFYKSASIGIISHPNRYVSDDTDGDGVSDWDANYIQHDAAINEGNSGGPLINLKGEIVGINTTKISAASVDNMGFAIPINLVIELVSVLEQGIQPKRPKLGITVIAVRDVLSSADLQSQYPIPNGVTYGMYVAEVSTGGFGDKAGIKSGDILIEFNGIKIYNSAELRAEIGKIIIGSGETKELKVYRNNTVVSLSFVS